jgi:hypothetical protein
VKRVLLLLLSVLTLAALPAEASNRSSSAAGARWLAAHVGAGGDGFAADTLVALRAARRLSARDAGRRAAGLRRGARSYVSGAGQAAKVILGLAAAHSGSARCAGSLDLRIAMGRDYTRGRYGRNAFDDALALLALRALRERVPTAAIGFLRAARGAGGWNVLLHRGSGPRDDVSSTAIAILALRAAGVSRRDRGLREGLAWMARQRTRSGGFALGRRDRNEANSTALAIEAERAMGGTDRRAARVLRGLQRRDGAFQFTADDAGSRVIASTESVVALSGAIPPVARARRHPGGLPLIACPASP